VTFVIVLAVAVALHLARLAEAALADASCGPIGMRSTQTAVVPVRLKGGGDVAAILGNSFVRTAKITSDTLGPTCTCNHCRALPACRYHGLRSRTVLLSLSFASSFALSLSRLLLRLLSPSLVCSFVCSLPLSFAPSFALALSRALLLSDCLPFFESHKPSRSLAPSPPIPHPSLADLHAQLPCEQELSTQALPSQAPTISPLSTLMVCLTSSHETT